MKSVGKLKEIVTPHLMRIAQMQDVTKRDVDATADTIVKEVRDYILQEIGPEEEKGGET